MKLGGRGDGESWGEQLRCMKFLKNNITKFMYKFFNI